MNTRRNDPPPNTIAFDIEVVGPDFASLDEPTRDYLMKRARTEEEREHVPERTALELGLGKVVAIGMHDIDADRTQVLLASDAPLDDFEIDGAHVSIGVEPWMLVRFWSIIKRAGRIVSFFGRGYDGPVLMVRSAQLGIPSLRDLVPYRYDIAQHCDLADVLTWQGAVRNHYNLDWWCRRFGLESPKEAGITGADVGRLYNEGRIAEIGSYVARDVRQTAALYGKLAPTILGMFKGGPVATAQTSLI